MARIVDAATQPGVLAPTTYRFEEEDRRALDLLESSFGAPFALVDGRSGELLSHPDGVPETDWDFRGELCRVVADRGSAEIIQDEDPLAVLAVPLARLGAVDRVAVGAFVVRPLQDEEDIARSAASLGMPADDAQQWAARQVAWARPSLIRVARLAMEHGDSLVRIDRTNDEIESVSQNLANTYEEISLLYRLTHNLRISRSDDELARLALKWLADVVPARAFVMHMLPRVKDQQAPARGSRRTASFITYGECPLEEREFVSILDRLELSSASQPMVLNESQMDRGDWPFGEVQQLVIVPVAEGENLLGHLAAINHLESQEFGTIEASLLNSVAAILGIHSGNIELYRQQRELLEGIIRSLISAIDAKDPYTCGHSDRVAKIAVRLAQEMDCDPKLVEAIYLSGLLHDIGKIGIDDAVLRKPGKLTDDEYEHIKTHVSVGHRILRDLRKLDEVLPVVLHHHESWDGKGYPGRLGGEEIPLSARIVAVADSYDAMASNRPYRRGMPAEKIESIFRNGAGQQWDPAIVEALFQARDEIHEIAQNEDD